MEFKVKEVNPIAEKSVQEVEEKLLKKHDEELSKDNQTSAEVAEEQTAELSADEKSEVESPTLKDEDVLSYIKNRYNKDIDSVDDLFAEKENR